MVHSILKAPTQPTGIISLFHGEILKGKKKNEGIMALVAWASKRTYI